MKPFQIFEQSQAAIFTDGHSTVTCCTAQANIVILDCLAKLTPQTMHMIETRNGEQSGKLWTKEY